MTLEELEGWTPVHVTIGAREPEIVWARVDAPFADPFFEQSAQRAMSRPFNQVFARRTPLGVLDEIADHAPAVVPSGLILHMSRCGSTVVSQMLAVLSNSVVLSEAQPLDALLVLHAQGRLDDEALTRRLGAMLSALAGGAGRAFVKTNAWHVRALPALLRAFGDVPWLFVVREPAAVLASHARAPGPDGFEDGAAAVASFCEAALRYAGIGRGTFFEYTSLPEGVIDDVLPFFGIVPTTAERSRMRAAAKRDTKRDGPFVEDGLPPPFNVDPEVADRLSRAYAELSARARSG